MILNTKIYKEKILKFYFNIDGYDFRDDKILTYQEAVLIDFVLNLKDRKTFDTKELDNIGVYAKVWWNDCIARYFDFALIYYPWNKVLKDKRMYYLKDTKYDGNGKRIPWQELEPYKTIVNFENNYERR